MEIPTEVYRWENFESAQVELRQAIKLFRAADAIAERGDHSRAVYFLWKLAQFVTQTADAAGVRSVTRRTGLGIEVDAGCFGECEPIPAEATDIGLHEAAAD